MKPDILKKEKLQNIQVRIPSRLVKFLKRDAVKCECTMQRIVALIVEDFYEHEKKESK